MSKFVVEPSQRIKNLPPYLFAKIDKMKEEVKKRGVDIISLGIGDPDLPTPPHIIKKLHEASQKVENHQYPSYEGLFLFRKAVADFYKNRFNTTLDPETEVVSLIGSKEGIAHFPLAFIDPGDYALVPEPGYPVYAVATRFAGGNVHYMPLLERNKFLPDLSAIPSDIAKKSKVIFINYPNNPTGATATKDFYLEVIDFAKKYNIIVCHDAAYSEMFYDGKAPISFLEVKGAMEVGVEFHSLSKTYNMTGWRIGWVAGHREIVGALGKIKTNIDSGIFQAIQEAGAEALLGDQSCVKEMQNIYQERRDILTEGLEKIGFKVNKPAATFYMWIRIPDSWTSSDFAALLLEKAGIVVTPGNGFGESGEGYIRMALTVDKDRLKEAVERIKSLNIKF